MRLFKVKFLESTPDFPKEVEVKKKISDNEFIVVCDKIPQDWFLIAEITDF